MFDSIFSPAFGNRPRMLVGRDEVKKDFIYGLRSMPGSRERARLLLGQRGSGKTVLLLEMAEMAQKHGFVAASPTITSKGMLSRIIEKLETSGAKYLPKGKNKVSGGSIGAAGFNAGIQFQDTEEKKRSFAFQLSHICSLLNKSGKGVLILVDEVQSNREELRELIIAYQEMVGEGRDIALVMAGLPGAIFSTLNDHVLTFLNRASKIELSPLRISEVDAYYLHAFRELGVNIAPEFRMKAARSTYGSPYLMQLIGHNVTNYASDDGIIDSGSFQEALERSGEDFENDICKTALNALSEADIFFLNVMAEDDGSSRMADIIERLQVSSAYAQLYKRRLRDAGIIEQVRRGEVQFAVPYLRDYLRKQQL